MRLQHVGITVPPEAVEPARAFYGDLLGLRELVAGETVLVYGLGQPGDLELHVVASGSADPDALHHFAFEVAELAPVRTRLVDEGYETADARPVGGRERFFVRDPFGNLIEFVTPRA